MIKLALLAALALSVASAAQAGAPEPRKPVDLPTFYSGVWAEIGRRPMGITNGCVAGATRYRVVTPVDVQVRDTCRQGSPTGPEKAIGGPGRILDPGTNARLHVSYRLLGFIPIGRDYWVLDHDEGYTWFISSDPQFENLWIYTRNPHVDPVMLQALVNRARALGYDVTKLEFPAQP